MRLLFGDIYSERRELHVPRDNSTDFKRNNEREKRLLSNLFLSMSQRGRRFFLTFPYASNSLTAETTGLSPGSPAVFPSPKNQTPIQTGKCLDRDNFIKT